MKGRSGAGATATRRTAVGSALSWWVTTASACARPQADRAPPVRAASSWLDAVGVNTHLPYTDGPYGDLARVAAALRYSGLTHIRDRAPQDGFQGQESYERLPQMVSGLSMCLFVSGDINRQVDRLATMRSSGRGLLSLVEGPNEINNEGAVGVAKGDHSAAQDYQERLYRRVRGTPALSSVPLLNFTDYPDHPGRADAANFHSYPKDGRGPAATLSEDLARQRRVQPQGPVYLTECGYKTAGSGKDGVDEQTQARLLLTLLAQAFALGVRRSYVYELLDDARASDRWGLFRADGTPKPAATALRDVSGWLKSTSSSPTSAVFKGLQGGEGIQLARPSGARDLLLWAERPGLRQVKLSTPAAGSLLRPMAEPVSLARLRDHTFEMEAGVALLRLHD